MMQRTPELPVNKGWKRQGVSGIFDKIDIAIRYSGRPQEMLRGVTAVTASRTLSGQYGQPQPLHRKCPAARGWDPSRRCRTCLRSNVLTGIGSSNGQQFLARAIAVVEIRDLSRDRYLV